MPHLDAASARSVFALVAVGLAPVVAHAQPRDASMIEHEASAFAVESGFAYLGSPEAGLHVYDLVAPSRPRFVRTLWAERVHGLHAEAGFLYVLHGRGGLLVYALADPDAPELVFESVCPIQVATPETPYTLAAGDGLLAISSPTEVCVADISTPGLVIELRRQDIFPSRYTAFAGGSFAGGTGVQLNMMDLDQPPGPDNPYALVLPRPLDALAGEGDAVYLGISSPDVGLVMLDISVHGSPSASNAVPLGLTHWLDRRDGTLWAADDSDPRRLHRFDLTDPFAPRLTGIATVPRGGFNALSGRFWIASSAGPDPGSSVIVELPPSVTDACSIADLAPPHGAHTTEDLAEFIERFLAADPTADPAPPMGVLSFDDVLAFLAAFAAGCPG